MEKIYNKKRMYTDLYKFIVITAEINNSTGIMINLYAYSQVT